MALSRCQRCQQARRARKAATRSTLVDKDEYRHPRAGRRRDLGQAHQGGADGEPLPPGAAADREPAGRGPGHVRRAGAHGRRAGQGSAAVGVHGGRRAQRPDEEHRSLGHRRLDVVLRGRKPALHLRAPVARTRCVDKSLLPWLQNQLKAIRIEPQRICFQVSEQVATEYLDQTKELVKALRRLRLPLRARAFRRRARSAAPARHLPVRLHQGRRHADAGPRRPTTSCSRRCASWCESAKAKKVDTIAERVEDANTMAVLWQLGIEFIQGYFVNEPEEVVIGSR